MVEIVVGLVAALIVFLVLVLALNIKNKPGREPVRFHRCGQTRCNCQNPDDHRQRQQGE